MIPKKFLIEYIPESIRGIKDFKYLMDLFTKLSHQLVDEITIFEEQFLIETCNKDTLSKWENTYGIVSKNSENIESRKFRVLSRMQQNVPFTAKSLQEYLTNILGEDKYILNIDVANFSISLNISLLHKNKVSDIKDLFNRMIPCNMVFAISLIYNYYGLFISKNLNYEQMKNFTHYQLREEYI